MNKHNFYAVIIGSEILNGRRVDKHFEYVRNALLLRGHTLYATFIIKDDEESPDDEPWISHIPGVVDLTNRFPLSE